MRNNEHEGDVAVKKEQFSNSGFANSGFADEGFVSEGFANTGFNSRFGQRNPLEQSDFSSIFKF